MGFAMTAREFNQNVSKAVRAARQAPVTITERGEEAFVLLNIRDYRQLHREEIAADFLRALVIPENAYQGGDGGDDGFDEVLAAVRQEDSFAVQLPDFDEEA